MEYWQLLTDIWDNDVARVFSIAIVVILALSLLGLRSSGKLAALSQHGVALCTTLGVLGTFTGIFLGLLQFDVAEIDASVPELLAGLKIAFSTSIVGLGSAILLRAVRPFIPARSETTTETTPEAIHQTLHEINNTIIQTPSRQTEALTQVRNAISDASDSNLVTHTQKLQTAVEDGNRQLITEFKQFSETMTESNSRALIEALEQVIRDFNSQLSEQFGENFKELNQAVGALLDWQEKYKEHVEIMQGRIEAAVTALQGSETALASITAHTTQIPEALGKLQSLLDALTAATGTLQNSLDGLGHETEVLNAHLKAVADLRQRALEAFPTIESNIGLLTASLTNTIDAHTETINKSANSMQQQHQDHLRKSQDLINQHFDAFDQQMQDEMRRSIEVMSRQLASLSEKFATDYTPLTQRLREILDAVPRRTS